ncbi:GGDEF domain-containing protein [Sphingomonas sp. I4]
MDLDRFKAVNDTLGHPAGDLLLQMVARRLEQVVGDVGLVGRLGGDEFQILLPGIDARDRLASLAGEIITTLSRPYDIHGNEVTIGCSIGIAIAPEDGADSQTLIRNADLGLYAAKGPGAASIVSMPRRCWRARAAASGWRRICASPSRRASSTSPINPSCRPATPRSSASRRCCAGVIRPRATSPRRSSSRSPRNAG